MLFIVKVSERARIAASEEDEPFTTERFVAGFTVICCLWCDQGGRTTVCFSRYGNFGACIATHGRALATLGETVTEI